MMIELMQFSSKSRAGCYITDAITCWDRAALLRGGLWDSSDRALVSSLVGQGSVADAEALAQDAQIGGGCPIPGNIQPEQGSGQPDRVEGVPVHCRGLDQVTFKSSFPTQTLA